VKYATYLLLCITVSFFLVLFFLISPFTQVNAATVQPAVSSALPGYTPLQIQQAYNIPPNGGNGTIAIIEAYHYANLENDLAQFNSQFNITPCTRNNGCLTVIWPGQSTGTIEPSAPPPTEASWSEETMVDVEWAHAIAPLANLVLVETDLHSDPLLMNAVDLARSTSGVAQSRRYVRWRRRSPSASGALGRSRRAY